MPIAPDSCPRRARHRKATGSGWASTLEQKAVEHTQDQLSQILTRQAEGHFLATTLLAPLRLAPSLRLVIIVITSDLALPHHRGETPLSKFLLTAATFSSILQV